MQEIITSAKNPLIKHVKSLHNKKYRDLYKQYVVEGVKMVEEAIKEKMLLSAILVSQEFNNDNPVIDDLIYSGKVKVCQLPPQIYKTITDMKNPEGIMAVVHKKEDDFQDIFKKDSCFILILDRVQDPGNLGTMIRTLDAAGGDGIIMIKGTVDPYNPKALRASMGSIFRIPVLEADDPVGLFKLLKSKNIEIIASHLNGSSMYNLPIPQKVALVIGNESQGISPEIAKAASFLVKIPMKGGAESLNASVAAGILIYEIFRKKNVKDR